MHCIAQNGVSETVRPRYSSVGHCLFVFTWTNGGSPLLEGGGLAMRFRYPLFQYLYQATNTQS